MNITPLLGIALLFPLLQPLPAAAQQPYPFFHNYSTNDGLPSPEVHCILQDRDGFMWFGTDNGACRFDGNSFEVYDHTKGLGYNVVLSILQDESGVIWFSTMNGPIYQLAGDTLLPYAHNHVIDAHRSQFVDAKLVALARDKTAYIKLTSCGLLQIDSTGDSRLVKGETPESILIFRDSNACLVVNNQCQGARTFFPTHVTHSRPLEFLFDERSIQSSVGIPKRLASGRRAYGLPDSQILVCTRGASLYLVRDSLHWIKETPYMILDLIQGSPTGWWAGLSHGLGIRYYEQIADVEKDKFVSLLSHETITFLYLDRSGGLWAASHESGVFYCSNKNVSTFGRDVGFSSDFVRSIAHKSANELFAGTDDGNLFHFNQGTMAVRSLHSASFHATSENPDLFYDSQNKTLWADNEFYVGGKRNLRITTGEGYVGFGCQKYHYDKTARHLWMLRGYMHYVVDPSARTVVEDCRDFGTCERLFAVFVDESGQRWGGTNRGLVQALPDQLVSVDISHPAFHHRIEDIDAFDGKHLILGTKGRGVIIWKNDQIIEVNTDHGLASNMIEDVHVDENNIAWIATFNGLSRMTLDENDVPEVRTYTMGNGLPSNEIYQIKSYEGQPWLCTAKGLVKWVDPPIDSTSRPPMINRFTVNDLPSEATQLKHHQNNISIGFLTINYKQFGKIPYRYRLNAQDNWSQTMERNIHYAKLSPGTYQFEVQSQNENGFWSPSTYRHFQIRYPWYQTTTFYVLGLLAIVALGAAWQYWRRSRQRQKELIHSEIENLRGAALRAQMNPHFIFNCLNSIQSFFNHNREEDANMYLARFARLIRGCLDASLDEQIAFARDVALLKNYLELEKMRCTPMLAYSLSVSEQIDQKTTYVTPMIVLPFVENAIVHGMSEHGRHVRIDIDFQNKGDYLQVTVKDNGPGLQHRGKHRQHQPSPHRSVGISLSEKRLQLINEGDKQWVSLKNIYENGEIAGTLVTLQIKTSLHHDRAKTITEGSHH